VEASAIPPSTKWSFEALVDVTQVARGDCGGPSLDSCELYGVQAYDTDPQRQMVIAHLWDRYGAVLEGDVKTSIAALLAIMLGLFLLVTVVQKQGEMN
jgi:hypothetical protein